MMPGSGDDVVQMTGGQVDSIVLALIDATFDKHKHVSQAVCCSLYNLGKHQPNLVLSSCHSYLLRHQKAPLAHKVLILGVMEKVSNETLSKINRNVAIDVIKQAIEEMVSNKEVVPELQNSASGILVSLGSRFHNEIMEYLIVKFQPGILPHFFVVQTLANLSTANVFGMVPYLKAILGTMLSLLGMVKQENMKWIFAYALAHFSDTILEYIANLEKAPDPTVKKEVYASEIGIAYDILFVNWLQSREAKVRSEVVAALGHMTHLLSKEKLEEQLPKIIPVILSLYKRQQESYRITQGLCMILDAATSNQISTLDIQLDNILNILFPQVCALPDYSQPMAVKNHNEVLRCFAVLTPLYSTRLISFLLHRVDNNNGTVRIGALTILKHLINSCDDYLSSKKSAISLGLQVVINDPSNKVKKILTQVIVAMAHHEYLELDGGQAMVWFIVRQCALPDDHMVHRPVDPDYVSNETLRGMCENVMHLLTTTVEKMENVLWPDLLGCITSQELTMAISPVCKSLAYLAAKRREELGPDFSIEYDKMTNLPNPVELLARLFVLLGQPLEGKYRGIHILNLLKAIVPLVDKSLMALWDTEIPQFIKTIEKTQEDGIWDQNKWEDDLVLFVQKTIQEVDRESWAERFAKALLVALPQYANCPEDKLILLKILGVSMKRIGNKAFINQILDIIFENIQHSNPVEREGCAVAVGYCGSAHFDAVLVKLEKVASGERKNTSIFQLIKEFKGDSEHEKLKATIVLCYGHVVINAPSSILTTRIETPILRSVNSFSQSSKDLCVKQSMLQTVKMIADALHPSHLKEAFIFHSKNELLNQIKLILAAESSIPLTSSVRSLAMTAAASLVSLNQMLPPEESSSLIHTAVSAFYPLPRDCHVHKPRDDDSEDNHDFDQLLLNTEHSLNILLKQILFMDRTPENVQVVIKALHPWLISKRDIERERSIQSVFCIFTYYVEDSNMPFLPFTKLGSILGMLIPRCTDPQLNIRHKALDCVYILLQISRRCQSKVEEISTVSSFENLKVQIVNDDPTSLFTVTNDLTKVISEKLSSDQLNCFIKSALDGLCDPHYQSSSGTSVVINGIIKLRCREMPQTIPEILDALRIRLGLIICPQTRIGALRCIRNLAIHNLSAVITSMLHSPLPFDDNIMDSWRILAQDQELGASIIKHLLDLLKENALIEDQKDPHNQKRIIRQASLLPLQAICGLREMFCVAEMEKCAQNYFEQIFSSLLLAAGTYHGVCLPLTPEDEGKKDHLSRFGRIHSDNKLLQLSPLKCSIEAFKAFLLCAKEDGIVTAMADGGYWIMMQDELKFPEAVAALASALSVNRPQHVHRIVAALNPLLSSPNESQRIVTVALFAELLTQKYENKNTLTEPLMNTLLGRLSDPSHTVRKLCIRGLGYFRLFDKEQMQRHTSVVLSAMMTGMDDKDDPENDISIEAMNGLSSILEQVSEEDVHGILVNTTLRIRPMFEKENSAVRAAALTLYGNLCRFGNGQSKETVVEQIHQNMVSLLLHLNDENKSVVKACKNALRQVGPLLQSENINAMFQKFLLDEAHLHYGEFINDLSKALILDFPDKLHLYVTSAISYFKSSLLSIRCNAAILLGFLLGNLPADKRNMVSKEKACGALIIMLQDSSPELRIKAAEALSLLYAY